MTEFSANYLSDDDHAVISTDEKKWVNKLYKLAEEYPNEVEIRSEYKDGFVTAHVPKEWVRVRPPAKREMTDEQKQAAAERLTQARKRKKDEEEMSEDELDALNHALQEIEQSCEVASEAMGVIAEKCSEEYTGEED
jgi:imidazolonepropionase-like amidohydrolase